jgi:preprotein translocase subunit SecA
MNLPFALHAGQFTGADARGTRTPRAPGAAVPRRTTRGAARRARAFARAVVARVAAFVDCPADARRQSAGGLAARLGREGLGGAAAIEACALVVAEIDIALGFRLHPGQLAAVKVILDQGLAELATGEGKTLAAAAAAAVGALAGTQVHVVTANDYLVARDAALFARCFAALGLTVGTVLATGDEAARRAGWRAQVTYVTAKELVFDHLRDRLAGDPRELVRRAHALGGARQAPRLGGLAFAIVDEADSVLLDEALTPCVLARGQADPAALRRAREARELARALVEGRDWLREAGGARLTGAGEARLLVAVAGLDAWWRTPLRCRESVTLALCAEHLLCRDRDYLVQGERVVYVEPTSGRARPERSFAQGLQQLLELKEDVPPTSPSTTEAATSFQRFFPHYRHLAGMSGTLGEARGELLRTYGLGVVNIPSQRPSRLRRARTRLFADDATLRAAVCARVAALSQTGRPVLVGTDSVAESEILGAALAAAGLPVSVLNARHDAEEAATVARAGAAGRVTVSTNLAGRGTDITLSPEARAAGGLHVLLCQHNRDRRHDRQLAGRAARQGDPGSAEQWLALRAPLFPAALAGALRGLAAHLPGWSCALLVLLRQALEAARARAARAALAAELERIDSGLALRGPAD